MAIEIACRKTVVLSGGRRYPLFVGFAPAADIVRIADAPSFTDATSHREIAVNILEPPVKDWQRPLDHARIDDIRLAFRDEGALMPNPVLLSANGEGQGTELSIRQEYASAAIPTDSWIVEIQEPLDGAEKPLWILDGQHRIHGMAVSRQAANEIPVVLLLNDGIGLSYNGRDFANLFAQVTTTAKKLDELHNEWLTFAYGLDNYSDLHPDTSEHRLAMETVAELCRRSEYRDTPNPFHNNVRFNPETSLTKQDGFLYGCVALKELIRKNYFAQVDEPVEPEALAEAISMAHVGLSRVVANQDESVFFGAGDFGHVAMQDAFLIGVMSYVAEHGSGSDDWESFLRELAFHQTDWRFKRWVRTTGGKAGTDSRNVAQRVMADTFRVGELPDVDNLADYLRGSQASVEFVFSNIGETGSPRRPGQVRKTVGRTELTSADLESRRHIKIDRKWKQSNIARLEVIDSTSSVANPRKYPEVLGRGHVVTDDADPRELQLTVHMVFYGGLGSDAQITLTW